jgi:hypothetical protein
LHSQLESYNLPGGQLTLIVKAKIWLWPEGLEKTRPNGQLEHGEESGESLSDIMLDNFVDIGGSSVLLVFQDGEQQCHTFPLAAREDSF